MSAERHLNVQTIPEITEKGEPALRLLVLGSGEVLAPNAAELGTALVQSKRLALLTYLSLASPRGYHRRDKLTALFWPELDDSRARHALRQAVHTLRRAMGVEVIVGRGDDELAVDRDLLWCDARVFHDLLDSGEEEKAFALYRGDLLPGLFVSGASPDLDQWIESERAHLRSRASEAAWKLSSLAEQQGDGAEAARWARTGTALSRDDEASLRRLISLLDRLGDRVGALRAYDDFSRWIASEFDAEPSAETKELIDAVRARRQAREANNHLPSSTPTGSRTSSFEPNDPQSPATVGKGFAAERSSGAFRRRSAAYASIAAAALALAAFGYARVRDGAARTRSALPIVAVGNIVENGLSRSDTTGAAGTLEELLSTDLARVSGLHVVSHSRLYEVLGQSGNRATTSSAVSDAAHRAGATHLIEGVLYRRSGTSGMLRLDLRRVDLGTGVVSQAWSVEGKDLFTLSDSVTAQFAIELGRPRPARSLAGTTSTSLVARRFYEHGIRWFYQGEFKTASRYFLAALDEDSTFGMAAFRAIASSPDVAARKRVIPLLASAARNASDAPERDRLLIRYSWAQMSNDPATVSLAESLAVRFPNEPDGERSWGSALLWAGDFDGAITHLKRAVARDSMSFSPTAPVGLCPACDAMSDMVTAYLHADSVRAAELAARGWQRVQPASSLPRMALAEVLGRAGRRAEALNEASQAARGAPSLVRDSWLDLRLAIAAGDFPEAHRLLAVRAQDVNQDFGDETTWWRIITLRYEGRMIDASAAVDRFCNRPDVQGLETNASIECSLAAGPVLFERGKYREAARLYEGMPTSKDLLGDGAPVMTGLVARRKSWMLTHAATAYAAGGDTVRLKLLTDSVERWGLLGAFGRDRLLHFHLRGLLSAARGQHSQAIELFRKAMFAPSEGYTRTNFELARELIASGKPREAIGPLRSALRGPIQGANLYVTQTEIHYMLADAFEKSGARDSAAVHFARVASAWQHSDPAFRARLAVARRKARLVH